MILNHLHILLFFFNVGKRGVYTDSKGLKIAYISGIVDKEEKLWTYTTKDARDLCDVCVKGNPSFRGVDILLTSNWPSNIIDNSNQVYKTY